MGNEKINLGMEFLFKEMIVDSVWEMVKCMESLLLPFMY